MADDLIRPANDLYERDYVSWAEAQAAALRARGTGPTILDYDNLAEEVEDLGRSETHACSSQVENIIAHFLKIQFVGPIQTIPHWKGEISNFRWQLAKRLTRTIENRLPADLHGTFAHVVRNLATRGLLPDVDSVLAITPGYDWDQIVDPDWYPDPRYGD
jgi:hypothetical protein